MTSAERGPVYNPPDQNEPVFSIIEGDGTNVWSRKPSEFGVDVPISAFLFRGSNLLRNLHDYDIIKRKTIHRHVEETTIPRTSRAALIREVYRHCLPKELRELADRLGDEAGAVEFDYENEGFAQDPGYKAELRGLIPGYRESLLMQGFEAFIEASYDYDNGLHEELLRDAQIFGAFLIDQTNQ